MAWSSVGFDGTINEAQWSALAGLLGNGYVAAGNGDCLVTAVAGARSVSVAAGSLYGDGVLSTNSAPETVAMTTPVNGQWYVIALRRTWATNTAALVAIAGATTTTTTPTAPPTSFPTLNTNTGVLTDQPIAWAWCNSANTTVVVYDIRLKAVKSLPPVVANANERDAKFMSPTQGLQVWRDDLGAVETYYGLYNSSTNPGGRDAAGWYTTNRSGSLIPMKPTAVTAVSGSATATALGEVSFTNVSSIRLDGVLNGNYSHYFIDVFFQNSTNANLGLRYCVGGLEYNGSVYNNVWSRSDAASFQTGYSLDTFALVGMSTSTSKYSSTIELKGMKNSNDGAKISHGRTETGGYYWQDIVCQFTGASVLDGVKIFPTAGTMTGTAIVYGVNR